MTGSGAAAVANSRTAADFATARAVLAIGGVLAFATESSYGLGVDPRSERGVEAIYRLKGRERGKPLPVVAADVEQIVSLGVSRVAAALEWASPRWPAALTVVLPLAAPIAASAGVATIAARIPARAELRALLAGLGTPLTATSANPSGAAAICDPRELTGWLAASGERFHLMDWGMAPGGSPSTLVELVEGVPRVLRAGAVNVV
jgi:L-threonylcarbamoyladenylate synthase